MSFVFLFFGIELTFFAAVRLGECESALLVGTFGPLSGVLEFCFDLVVVVVMMMTMMVAILLFFFLRLDILFLVCE
jgi:hypothetical protein